MKHGLRERRARGFRFGTIALVVAAALTVMCAAESPVPVSARTAGIKTAISHSVHLARYHPHRASSIHWKRCGFRLDCARVLVPLDWAHPDGPKIMLAVIRHRASRRRQKIGTLFFNPGGPGVSGVDTVKNPDIARLLDQAGGGRFDVVSWDTRGSGASTHVTCFRNQRTARRFWGSLTIPTTPAASRRYLAKAPATPSAAVSSAALSWPTSRPRTPPATSTICARSCTSAGSPILAGRTAAFSVRPMRTCFRTGSARWCSTASSMR